MYSWKFFDASRVYISNDGRFMVEEAGEYWVLLLDDGPERDPRFLGFFDTAGRAKERAVEIAFEKAYIY